MSVYDSHIHTSTQKKAEVLLNPMVSYCSTSLLFTIYIDIYLSALLFSIYMLTTASGAGGVGLQLSFHLTLSSTYPPKSVSVG